MCRTPPVRCQNSMPRTAGPGHGDSTARSGNYTNNVLGRGTSLRRCPTDQASSAIACAGQVASGR
jgi:hypothetical protein